MYEKAYKRLISGRPAIRIGKSGISEGMLNEIMKKLRRDKAVKIRVMKSFLNRSSVEDIAKDLATRTGSIVVDVRGHTFVLFKKAEG